MGVEGEAVPEVEAEAESVPEFELKSKIKNKIKS